MIELKSNINKCVIIISLFIISTSHNAYGQWDEFFKAFGSGPGPDVEFGGGISTLHQFNLPKPIIGMHLKYRLKGNDISIFGNTNKTFFYLGASYYFKQGKQSKGNFNAIPKDTLLFNPIVVPYQFKQSVSYLMFDIGEDYYLFTNEKESFSLYGGWLLGANIPFYKGNYEIAAYDQTNYILQTETDWKENRKESKANFKAGLNFGIDIYVGIFGSLYFETSTFVNLLSEKYLPPDFTINSRFFLGFNVGYRYEF